MKKSNFALRLQPTLFEEAKELAKSEGVALNQLINVAVAEKLAVSRAAEFFRRYTRDADVVRAKEILARSDPDNPPMPGDKLPKSWKHRRAEKTPEQKTARSTRSK